MKNKVVLVVLAVVCLLLLIGLFAIKKTGEEQHVADANSILELSNQVVNAGVKINDLNQVNLALTNDLASSRQQIEEISNHLATTAATLAASQTELADSQGQITNLNARISDLESQNKTLDERIGELTNNLVQLNLQIAETQQKLIAAGSANAYLQQELQRQMAQKAELEHNFNDLDVLRQQVKKIKSDIFTARRLQFMKNDISGKKGAELLLHPNVPAPATASSQPANGLNVEIGSDGSVRVIPPIIAPTNAPAP
jgi:chromosome segregation ATPase